jgi:hypothetical protein
MGAADRGTVKQRVEAAIKAAYDIPTLALGAVGGALAPVVKEAGAVKPRAIPVEDLKAAKGAAYKAVENAGVTYKPDAFAGLVDNITKDAVGNNLSPMRHPKAASMVSDLQNLAGSSPTLTEIDQLRQVIRRDVASSSDPAEKFFGRRMIDQIDQFIEGAGPEAVSAGSASDAAGLMATARDLNARYRKTEGVTEAVEKAKRQAGSTGSGGNVDNAIRQKLRTLLEKTPNLTAEEKAAFDKVILGGGRVQNTLRTVGKLSPQGNGLMTALSIGGTMANPALGVPTVAGAVSKTIADAMTRGNVDDLLRIVSTGGTSRAELEAIDQALTSAPATEAVNALRREVAAKLARAAGAQGATVQQQGAMPVR